MIRHYHAEELGPFCRPILAAGMQLSVHLINLLSRLLRGNAFARIQKSVVDQTGSRPPNSDPSLLWFKFGFGKYFGTST